MNRESVAYKNSISSPQERRRELAARWFITLQQAHLSERVLVSWKQWEAIPENHEAFDAVERVWQIAGHVPELSAASQEERAEDRFDGSVSVLSYLWRVRRTATSIALPRRRFFRRAAGLAAMAVAVMIAIQSLSALRSLLHPLSDAHAPDRTVVVETGLAEHKQIVFEDGSHIVLGAESSITANFSKTSRAVALDHGEAHFKVAHDRQRPFQVSAGGGTITAIGTAFNVQYRQDDDVVVTVTEGIVEVVPVSVAYEKTAEAPSAGERTAIQHVAGGQEVTYDSEGKVSPVRVADVMTTVAWRDGRFRYSDESLRHVVEDINRYSRHKLMLDDSTSTVGDLLYSGTVFTSDIQEWVAGLERTYPQIEVVTMADASVLIRARPVVEN